ncbi:MAG: rhodanese-like domain-containing protein [Gallionellaceae bacterium]|jgi:rhodanese-related sulfurtransferase
MYSTFKPQKPMGLMDFVKDAKACITEITPKELVDKLAKNEDLLLLDVREHGEYQNGHIKCAQLVPRGILEAAADPTYPKHVKELSEARERQVVVYCATSGRSAMACAVLQMMGFKNVLNLAGGYTRWVADGMPEEHSASY